MYQLLRNVSRQIALRFYPLGRISRLSDATNPDDSHFDGDSDEGKEDASREKGSLVDPSDPTADLPVGFQNEGLFLTRTTHVDDEEGLPYHVTRVVIK